METNFSHEQSLSLINEMISRAKNNFQKESKLPMIFWGYVIACTAIANHVLIQVLSNPDWSNLVWLVLIPCAGVAYFINRRLRRSAIVKTHIDEIGGMIWKGFGIGIAVFFFIVYAKAIQADDYRIMMLTNSVIMCMIGICEFIVACVYRNKTWYWVAALFWAGATASAFLPDWKHIILAVCMILGYVVPGHVLNNQTKQNHV